MAARRRKWKRQTITVKGLNRAEQCEAMDELYKKIEGMRKVMEAARSAMDEIVEFATGWRRDAPYACHDTSRRRSRMIRVPEESSSYCPTRRSGGRTRTAAGTGALLACTSI